MAETIKKVKISGRVQGVGFRYSMCDEALKAKLKGFVRNAEDGTVEAVFQGDPASVSKLIEWSKKGPPAAQVQNVEESDATGEFEEFEIRY